MEKIDQILDSLYDRVIEPIDAKDQLLGLFINAFFEYLDGLTQMEYDLKSITEHVNNFIYDQRNH